MGGGNLALYSTIKSFGFVPIRNLSGHGLGRYNIHTAPSIPNYDTQETETLERGQIIAIEPFITTGDGLIHEKGNSNVFMQVANNNSRPQTIFHISGRWRERAVYDHDKKRHIETSIDFENSENESTVSGEFTRRIIPDVGKVLETHGNLVGRYTLGYFYAFINDDKNNFGYAVFLLRFKEGVLVGRDCWYDLESKKIEASSKDIIWEFMDN